MPEEIRKQADALLFMLRRNPVERSLGVKKLGGINPLAFRIRVGVYRLVRFQPDAIDIIATSR